jgi:hypothetical protein
MAGPKNPAYFFMVTNIFKILLLLSPIIYGFDKEPKVMDIVFFQVGSIILFLGSLWDKPKRELDIKLFVTSFLGLGILSLLWHGFTFIPMMVFLNMFLGIMVLTILIRYVEKPEDLFKYIVIAGILNLALFVSQRIIKFDPIFDNNVGDPTFPQEFGGFMGNSSSLAIYIALILPFLFNFSFYLALGVFAFFMFYCKEAMLFPVIIFLCFFKFNKFKSRAIILSLCLVIDFFFYKHFISSIQFRWVNIWKEAINEFFNRPFLGHGLGTFYFNYGSDSFNSYLPFIFGVGMLGIVWLFYVMKYFVRKFSFTYSLPDIALLSFLVISLKEYPVEMPKLWFTIIFIIACFIIKKGGCDEGKVSRWLVGSNSGI